MKWTLWYLTVRIPGDRLLANWEDLIFFYIAKKAETDKKSETLFSIPNLE